VPNTGRNFGFQTLIRVDDGGSAVDDRMPTAPLAHPEDLRHHHIDVYRTIVMARTPGTKTLPSFPLNGKLFDPNRVDITMKLGDIEEWTIKSPDTKINDEWHNFHIHTNPFQVVAVNGHPLNYIDWQDTVNIPAGGSVTFLIHPIDFVGESVFHCHVDFHEDNGMMGTFQILRNPTPSQVNADRVLYMVPPDEKLAARTVWAKAATGTGSGWNRLLLLCHLGVEA
jgi:FtsP/CotA-like multicopper oxidase with cupredoxin domain